MSELVIKSPIQTENKCRKIIKEKIKDLFLIKEFNNILIKQIEKLDNTNNASTFKKYLKEMEKFHNSLKEILNQSTKALMLLQNNSNNKTNYHTEEFAPETTPDISLIEKYDALDKVDDVRFRKLPCFDSVATGAPNYPCEDIVGFVDIPENNLNPFKDYFAIKVKGDSMNEVFTDGELLLVAKTTIAQNNDLVIALISPNSCESTFKKFRIDDNYIHKVQIYNAENIKILGKVIGRISDFIH